MSLSESLILTGGILSIVMGIFHITFPRFFKWEEEFNKMSKGNRLVFYTIHLALILFLMGFGLISIIFVTELALKEGVSLGFLLMASLFWLWRTIWQITYFRKLRKLALHYFLSIYFLTLTFLYTISLFL